MAHRLTPLPTHPMLRRPPRWLALASLGMMLTCGTGTGTGNAALVDASEVAGANGIEVSYDTDPAMISTADRAADGLPAVAVREPGTLLLFGAGLLCLAFVMRRFSRG